MLDYGFHCWFTMHHYLTNFFGVWRPLLAVILFSFSAFAFADTYTARRLWPSLPFSESCVGTGLSPGSESAMSAYCLYNDAYNVDFKSYLSGPNYDCPYGGTVSGTSCINAPACPAGETRNASGECIAPPKTCGTGEYNPTPSTCAAIPSCQTETTGQYFDVNTGGCVSPQCPETGGVCDVKACEDTTKFYCAPTDNCKSSGSTCSNDPDEPDATKEQRDAQIAADRAAADADASTAAADKDAAAKAATDKAAEAATADAQQKAAEAAAKDASATQAARDAAAQDFINKAKESLAKTDAANNAADSSSSASQINQQIQDLKALIHEASTIDGNSDTIAKQIHDLLNQINQRLTDAINGYPKGTTTPPTPDNPCPAGQNCNGQASNKIFNPDKTPLIPPAGTGEAEIASKRIQYQQIISNAKIEFSALKPALTGGGGSFSCGGGVMLPVVNVQFEVCLAPYVDAFAIMGGAVYFASVVAAVFIILG